MIVYKGYNFADYVLLSKMGEGSTAEVWSCKKVDQNEEKAIKIFAPFNLLDDYSKKLIKNEFEETRDINHPKLILPEEYIEHDGVPAIIMRLCQKSMWQEYIDRKHIIKKRNLSTDKLFSERVLVGLIQQVSQAISYLHEKNMTHNDIKPANILVNNIENEAKAEFFLSDFGITKEIRDTIIRQTSKNVSLTFAYAAPEKLRGFPSSAMTDVFSLGVSVYELTSLKDVDIPPGEVLNNNGELQFSSEDSYSSHFIGLIRKMLSKDPDDRISVEDVIRETTGFLEDGKWPEKQKARKETQIPTSQYGNPFSNTKERSSKKESISTTPKRNPNLDKIISQNREKEKGKKSSKSIYMVLSILVMLITFSFLGWLYLPISETNPIISDYPDFISISEDLFMVEKDGKVGIINDKGVIVKPIEYESGVFHKDTAVLFRDGYREIVNLK